MFKIAAFVSLMLVGNLLAGSLSCDSCGNECASACGTRHFRSCCFNYLRRKRGPEDVKLVPQIFNEYKKDKYQRHVPPIFLLEEIPEQWVSFFNSADMKPYYYDTAYNRLQAIYDA